MKGVLDLGLDFEDIRDIAVDVCYGIVEGVYHPDLICPGIVDNFGPHVRKMYISCNLLSNIRRHLFLIAQHLELVALQEN